MFPHHEIPCRSHHFSSQLDVAKILNGKWWYCVLVHVVLLVVAAVAGCHFFVVVLLLNILS
jgi:hypothetical protein